MKNIITLLLLLSTSISFAQTMSYKINESTGQVNTIDKFIVEFNYMTTYDEDFEKWGKEFTTKVNLLIEKTNRDIPGRLVVLWDDKRDSFEILSCYYVSYTNKSDKYFHFKCKNEYGKIIYYNLDNISGWRLWTEINDNQRIYFKN